MDTLKITSLSKTYSNGVKALRNVSLTIPKGLYGLLGPNGAGKSTLMRIIATLQEADEGAITFKNLNVLKQKNELRKILGYLPQDFGLYPKISAEVLLDHLAVLKGVINRKERKELVKALLDKTNLYKDRSKNLGGYSGGMKRRFGIAQALLSNPQLLIVDEPTAGLDPKERNRFHNLLSELAEDTVVILSTHIVDDVKELCTKMAIINQGAVLLEGNPLDLIARVEGKIFKKEVKKSELDFYKEEYTLIAQKLSLGKPVVFVISEADPGNGFQSVEAGLEDVYFSEVREKGERRSEE